MKNKIFAATLSAVMLTATAANAEITVKLDGNNINFDVPPVIINDRTMVPFRAIFSEMGADIEWYDEEKLIYASLNGIDIYMVIGAPAISVGDVIYEIDTPPIIMNGRTLIPLRAVSEAFNMGVQWDGDTQTVYINTEYTDTDYTDAEEFDDGNDYSYELQVLDIVNQYRTEEGLSPLEWDDDLAEVARLHSEDMVERGFFSHDNPDGESPFDRMENYGIGYMAAAENIAAGQQDAQSVMDSWMNSQGHRNNIMNPDLGKIGIGIAYGGSYGIYWTQCFTD